MIIIFNCGANALSKIMILSLFKKTTNTEQASQKATDQKTQSGLSSLSGIGDFVAGLLGKDKVSKTSLVGTWSYKQPAVIFESENMLTNVGGMAAGKAAEEKLQGYLDKIGFTSGKVKMDFKEDGTGIVTYGSKNIPFQWSVAEERQLLLPKFFCLLHVSMGQ